MKTGKKKFCAHRGVAALMPEATLPAFAAAASLGADEIEFDVRLTKDKKLIVSHDDTLERISDGQGKLQDFTLEELGAINVGVKRGWIARFCTVEDVFLQFANRLTFNIHIKEHGDDGFVIKELLRLIDEFDARNSVYFAASPAELFWAEKIAPDIPRIAIQVPEDTVDIFDMVRDYHCSGVQFWMDMTDEDMMRRMHERGVHCNLFCAEDEAGYDKFFAMGADTILTNFMDRAADYRRKHPAMFE